MFFLQLFFALPVLPVDSGAPIDVISIEVEVYNQSFLYFEAGFIDDKHRWDAVTQTERKDKHEANEESRPKVESQHSIRAHSCFETTKHFLCDKYQDSQVCPKAPIANYVEVNSEKTNAENSVEYVKNEQTTEDPRNTLVKWNVSVISRLGPNQPQDQKKREKEKKVNRLKFRFPNREP